MVNYVLIVYCQVYENIIQETLCVLRSIFQLLLENIVASELLHLFYDEFAFDLIVFVIVLLSYLNVS